MLMKSEGGAPTSPQLEKPESFPRSNTYHPSLLRKLGSEQQARQTPSYTCVWKCSLPIPLTFIAHISFQTVPSPSPLVLHPGSPSASQTPFSIVHSSAPSPSLPLPPFVLPSTFPCINSCLLFSLIPLPSSPLSSLLPFSFFLLPPLSLFPSSWPPSSSLLFLFSFSPFF